MLLEKKANANAPGGYGRTPLDWAKRRRHTKIVEILEGYKPSLKSEPVHTLARQGGSPRQTKKPENPEVQTQKSENLDVEVINPD
mmetsp:Transcript_43975/g.70684  ORF Transcript_43975/g.70684 Transcript_43975/m.70684 type:complete len:85 (+) Transcript_43975:1-255(+)